jgi:sugar-specific transcriptional regulator TrmB
LVGRGWVSQEKVLKTLVDLGLTRIDARVYVFLAKKGPQKAKDVARFLRIPKQQLYPSLRILQSKGLVNSTLEHPTRFSAVSFEKALDLFAKAKMEEAKSIQQSKDEILTDWQSIVIQEAEDKSARFTVIEGRKYVYSKIQQMIQETKKQLSTVTTVPGLMRADQYGLLDAAFNHPLKSKVQFRFLTELSELNLDAMNSLLEKAPKTGFNLKGRNPELGLKLSPRMVIRDNEELLFFITPQTEDDSCFWTTCKELVRSFMAVFDELWRTSTDIEKNVLNIEKREPTPKALAIKDAETPKNRYDEVICSTQEEIIIMTSSEGLIDFWKSSVLPKEWAERDISAKIMAPITSKNLEAAKQLSKYIEVRHAPVSYLQTTIVDGKHLFQSKSSGEKPRSTLHFENVFYTNDQENVKKTKTMLNNIWKTARPPSAVTLAAIANSTAPPVDQSSNRTFHGTIKKIEGAILVDEEKPAKALTEKDVLNMIINAQEHPRKDPSREITRYYGTNGQAIIHPPKQFKLPDILIYVFHFEKNSMFGAEDCMMIDPWFETPKGYAYVPAAFVADNPDTLRFQKEIFKGLIPQENMILVKKDELRIRISGNTLFCGWTMEIPLIQKYCLPPSAILLEGYGKLKTRTFEIHYPSGYKLWEAYSGMEAFVTFFHPSSKYSGPGTDGFILRDSVMEIHPP